MKQFLLLLLFILAAKLPSSAQFEHTYSGSLDDQSEIDIGGKTILFPLRASTDFEHISKFALRSWAEPVVTPITITTTNSGIITTNCYDQIISWDRITTQEGQIYKDVLWANYDGLDYSASHSSNTNIVWNKISGQQTLVWPDSIQRSVDALDRAQTVYEFPYHTDGKLRARTAHLRDTELTQLQIEGYSETFYGTNTLGNFKSTARGTISVSDEWIPTLVGQYSNSLRVALGGAFFDTDLSEGFYFTPYRSIPHENYIDQGIRSIPTNWLYSESCELNPIVELAYNAPTTNEFRKVWGINFSPEYDDHFSVTSGTETGTYERITVEYVDDVWIFYTNNVDGVYFDDLDGETDMITVTIPAGVLEKDKVYTYQYCSFNTEADGSRRVGYMTSSGLIQTLYNVGHGWASGEDQNVYIKSFQNTSAGNDPTEKHAVIWFAVYEADPTRQIYTHQDWLNGEAFTRNNTSWVSNLNLTCASPWNNRGDGKNCRGTVLITPRHLLQAAHYTINGGNLSNDVVFVSQDNTVYRRKILTSRIIKDKASGESTDICISTLDEDLPASIKPAMMLPKDYDRWLAGGLAGVPVLYLNQLEEASLALGGTYYNDAPHITLGRISQDIPEAYRDYHSRGWGDYYAHSHEDVMDDPYRQAGLYDRDSGNPYFAFINSTNPVVLGCFYTTAGSDWGLCVYYDEIQEAIDEYTTGYTMTTVDLEALGYPEINTRSTE